MSYLKFDKNLLINLDQSLSKEMLRTNQAGAYHCTSLVGCNTRKQHGLLVIPIPELGGGNYVLLSSLDETVVQHGAPFNLGIHRYKGGVYSPNGHKYIREFDCESVPRITYRVGGVVLTKEKIFISQENRILIRYTLVDAHSATTLRFKPFLAFRAANDLCMANNKVDTTITPAEGGISCCMYPGFPRLYMQLSRKAQWTDNPLWYKDVEYLKDLERGEPYCEDLWVPGEFSVPIRKGESVIFSAGIEPVNPRSLRTMYEREIASRTARTSFYNCLKNAAKQYYYNTPTGHYIISGYPWGVVLARNTFMSLPGLTIAIDHRADFEKIARTALDALDTFIKTGQTDAHIAGIDLPDIPLWALWALQQYAKAYGRKDTIKLFGKDIDTILDAILDGSYPRLRLDNDGLVTTDGYGLDQPVSWMNSVLDGRPVVARTGKLVEFNALWYNALRFATWLYEGETEADAQRGLSKKRLEALARWHDAAERCKEAFTPTFLNGYGYLYDFVNGAYVDPQVRPNMAVAIGLDYSPLDRRQRKTVLDVVTRELLTPKGLRTLSPKSYGYRPFYLGSPREREEALHQGPARPWLMGFYADAYLRVFGMSGVSYIDRMLIGFEDDLSNGCIGSLSQLYDGNPPFNGRGAISHATNVAEVLRTLRTLKRFDYKYK